MSDLRLKVRKKIYTSVSGIEDTNKNNNAIVVFLGKKSDEKLKSYIDEFLSDTLKKRISSNKISFVQIDESNISDLPEILAQTVEKISFNPHLVNKLFISFVTLMDDDFYNEVQDIDISEIEEIKSNSLGGYSIQLFYDFYGIFTSSANHHNRMNARKTIINFLDTDKVITKSGRRVFHQACPGKDYYRTAKSITFMLLGILIEKIDTHTISSGVLDGDCYTWTTFSLFQKNIASLVVYEMVNKLLANQMYGNEVVSPEVIKLKIKEILSAEENEIKKFACVDDIKYIPFIVQSVETGSKGFFRRTQNPPAYQPVFGSIENSTADLLRQQYHAVGKYMNQHFTEDYCKKIITKLIKMCTVIGSVNNKQNAGLIQGCLVAVKNELAVSNGNYANQTDEFKKEYYKMLLKAQINILERLIHCFEENVDFYVNDVQRIWNQMNLEVNGLINDFAAFHQHFDGLGELTRNKTINLMCDYDELLNKIDIQSVMNAINSDSKIYSNVLASYYNNIKAAGEIVQSFGERPIAPDIDCTSYCLFTAEDVICPEGLKIVNDDYWFREYEMAILFTARNKLADCNHLPF